MFRVLKIKILGLFSIWLLLGFCIFPLYGASSSFINHTVRSGESLYKIAEKYLPLSGFYTLSSFVKEIKKINDVNHTGLKINKKLRIPVVRTKPVKAKTITKDKR